MFDLIRNNPRIAQAILALLILPFAVWGLESYFTSSGGDGVATVAGVRIAEKDYQLQLADQRDALREQMGERFDPTVAESSKFKLAVLEDMINRQLLIGTAVGNGMTVPDDKLADIIRKIPAFQKDGKFDVKTYETLLRQQGYTPASFQEQIRAQIVGEQSNGFFQRMQWMPQVVVDRAADLGEQERDVQQALISPDQFLDKVAVTADEVRAYFDKNPKEFEVPARLKIEYVMLDAAKVAEKAVVPDAEIEAFFKANEGKFATEEQRRASHILIGVDKAADAAARTAAKAKAQRLLGEVRAGKDFGELAKANSTDPGSAQQNGDLGAFGRGTMVKPFEDAVFALKVGQVSDVVETDFGYHIIKLTEIKGGGKGDLASARPQIEAELKKQRSAKQFAELAETFADAVYEQSDSLSAASAKLGTSIQTADNVTRKGIERDPLLGNAKFLKALFEDALPNKRNTEVVELSPTQLVAARVLAETPSSILPFAVIQSDLTDRLKRKKAAELAIAEGKRIMADLSAGKDAPVKWGANLTVSRKKPTGLPLPAMQLVFRARTAPLPSYAAVEIPGQGYAMFRINRVAPPTVSDPAERKRYSDDANRMMAEEEQKIYSAALRASAKVEVKTAAVEKTAP
ncbi:MAG: SurA N-terminal domain-containing protein [Burkholderiales bacterium]